MSRSIRWRFAIPIAVFFILAIIGFNFYLYRAFSQTYENSIRDNLTEEASLIRNAVLPLFPVTVGEQRLEELAHYYAGTLNIRVTIIRADGVVLAESDTDPAVMENHLNRPEVQQALQNHSGFQTRYSRTLGINMMYVALPVTKDGQVIAVVRLSRALTAIESSLNQTRAVVTAATLIVTALAVLIAILISNYTVQPIVLLTRTARKISNGDYESVDLPASKNEIGQLAQAFQQMLEKIKTQIQELEREQVQFSSVLDQMMDGVVIVNGDGIIQLINPAAEQIFKLRRENTLGKSFITAFGQYKIVDLWKKSAETSAQQSTTIDIHSSRIYLHVIAAPLGQVLPGSTLLLFQDLTDLRRLETVRQDFVSNVSHELRTPLASIKAISETLLEGALEDPPAARRFIEKMDIEIDSLTQMVRELLELSKIESGRVPLKLQAVRAIDLVTKPYERMRFQAERAGLSLNLSCPEDLPPVTADPERVEQVLVNLLHNAIKFTPLGGSIDLSVYQEDRSLVFGIRDTGVGIAEKDLPRIFERFYKSDRARSGGGTGLGLSIARRIIEAHGGRIWAESTPGQGSTFSFSLPVVQ